jgi:hypothetical protein
MSDHFYTTSAAERDYRTACSNLIGQSRDKPPPKNGSQHGGGLRGVRLGADRGSTSL